jgi:hypothetical protein
MFVDPRSSSSTRYSARMDGAQGGPRRCGNASIGRLVPGGIEGREACWSGNDSEATHERQEWRPGPAHILHTGSGGW